MGYTRDDMDVSEIRGTILGILSYGNPSIGGGLYWGPFFGKPPYKGMIQGFG